MLVQGFVAVRVGILKRRTFNDLGVAGCVGAVLISRGAGYAFAVGIVLCLLVYGTDFFRKSNTYDKVKDPVFNKCITPGPGRRKASAQSVNMKRFGLAPEPGRGRSGEQP